MKDEREMSYFERHLTEELKKEEEKKKGKKILSRISFLLVPLKGVASESQNEEASVRVSSPLHTRSLYHILLLLLRPSLLLLEPLFVALLPLHLHHPHLQYYPLRNREYHRGKKTDKHPKKTLARDLL